MAITKTVNLEVQSNLDEASKSVGSLKAQLREAQAEVGALSEKFGATSKEAVEAAKKAAQLKDAIGDAKALTDSFNPDAKFTALTNSLSGVAGGFSAVTGAMGLLGSESAEVEQMILKVQSAMAISQGIQAVGESIDSFKQLRAVVMSYSIVQKISTAAQWLWNTAMAANPIGAVVAVVVALIAAGYKLVTMFMDSAAANEQAMAATKKNTNALKEQEKASKNSVDKLTEYNTQQYNLAKANGASSESLRKLALKHAEEAVALNYKNTMLARSTFLREADTLATLKANDASDEAIAAQDKLVKASYQAFDKQREGLYDSYKQRRKVINDNEVAVAQEATDRRNKAVENEKQHQNDLLEKQKEANKKAAEERKRKADEEYKENQDRIRRRAEAAMEEEAKSFNAIKEARKANEDSLKTEQQLAIDNENLAYQLKYETALKFGQSTEELEIQHLNNLNNINLTAQQKQYADDEAASKAKIELAKLEAKAKMDALDSYGSALGSIAGMLGESTDAGKAAAIASTTISTYSAATKAYESQLAIPTPDAPVRATIAAGIAVASGLLNVQKILSVKTPGGGGGGSAPAAGGAPAAPSFNVVGNGGANQLAQVMSDKGAAPVQAFVVASNVTSAQSLNRNIVNNATLG